MKKKAIGINGSPRLNGNTLKLINEVFRGLKENKVESELLNLIDMDLKYCDWCGKCAKDGKCSKNDILNEHIKKIQEAGIIVVGCPVSTHTVTGYMKNWLDRVCNSQLEFIVDDNKKVHMKSRILKNKKSVIIVHGCTDIMEHALDPIRTAMKVLNIYIADELIVKNVGLTNDDTVDKRKDIMDKAYDIGKRIFA